MVVTIKQAKNRYKTKFIKLTIFWKLMDFTKSISWYSGQSRADQSAAMTLTNTWIILTNQFIFQCMRYSTFSASRSSSLKLVSKYLLCCGDIFHGGVWWFCARHMAVTALHGYYDLRSFDRAANTGNVHKLWFTVLVTSSLKFITVRQT